MILFSYGEVRKADSSDYDPESLLAGQASAWKQSKIQHYQRPRFWRVTETTQCKSYRTKGKVKKKKNKVEREKIAQGDAEFYFLFC